MTTHSRSGLTLIELMLAIVLSSVVLMGANMLYINVVRQENTQRELTALFSETKITFDIFRKLVESTGNPADPPPQITTNNRKITARGRSLESNSLGIVYEHEDGNTVTLSTDSAALFEYNEDDDTYRIIVTRDNYNQIFENEVRRRW